MTYISAAKFAIHAAFVNGWAATYPMDYDVDHYYPYLLKGKKGDPDALRKLTEWKNPGSSGPMRLSVKKEMAFQKLLALLNKHQPVTESTLRAEFRKNAPVYAIFWHHVLFDTPIFDVHTNRAFQWFHANRYLPQRSSAIPRGGHWQLYDAYCAWFNPLLSKLQQEDPEMDSRTLDRALFRWGFTNSKSLTALTEPPCILY